MPNSDTLCTHLWGHAVVDIAKKRVRACCKTPSHQLSVEELKVSKEDVFLNLPYMIADRELMLKGGKPTSCSTCWKLEDKGIKSFRTGKGDWLNYISTFGLDEKSPDLKYSFNPNNLDIQLDNYCDLKCIYCNQEFSSQWENENIKFGFLPYEFHPKNLAPNEFTEFNELFFSWFDKIKMGLERIAFLGGEPLISPIFYEYLEKIIESYNGTFPAKLNINIITNLNTPEKNLERFTAFLNKHSSKVTFNINISMEAAGEKAELIRYGVYYERFQQNLKTLLAIPDLVISTITTVNLFSISSLNDYLKFLFQCEDEMNKEIILYSNIISYPEYLNMDLVHEDFADIYLKECIATVEKRVTPGRGDLREYLRFLESLKNKFKFNTFKGSAKHKFAIECIELLNKRRNCSFKDTFPEYRYLWENRGTNE